jgi:hypothetical protein
MRRPTQHLRALVPGVFPGTGRRGGGRMSIIERLKTNKEAFGLMDKEMREVAEKIEPDRFEVWIDGTWRSTTPVMGGKQSGNFSYRLRADYVCQHPQTSKDFPDAHGYVTVKSEHCRWCNAEIRVGGIKNHSTPRAIQR